MGRTPSPSSPEEHGLPEPPRPPALSVIVPVYNTAPFLRQCLDSLLEQSFKDLEIVVVDDGSTDDSPQILAGYAETHGALTVICLLYTSPSPRD